MFCETRSSFWRQAFFAALWLLANSVVKGVSAEPQAASAKVRAEYIRLRNIDPSGDNQAHRSGWESLAAQMRGLAVQRSSDSDAGWLRFIAADTHLRLFRTTRQQTYLNSARSFLNPLVEGRVSSAISSDLQARALIAFGDANLCSGARESAESAYQRASTIANGTDAKRALQRLQGLQNGTFARYLPSQDFEVPRPISPSQHSSGMGQGPVVVLDPGHGGEDAGAVSAFGGEEKEITLDIARRVKLLLERRYGIRARLTRHDDQFMPLARRTSFANRKKAEMFVSLHVNASADHDAEGLEVYYLDNTDDEASRKLAERENGETSKGRVDDLSFMLSDLIQSGKLEDSILLSRALDLAVRRDVISTQKGLRSLGVKKAPFFVLVGAHMPCSLIEMFFIDHPVEGRAFRQESFRSALAMGIADGINTFLKRR